MSKKTLSQYESGADSMSDINSNFTELYNEKISGASVVSVNETLGKVIVGEPYSGEQTENIQIESGANVDGFSGVGVQNINTGVAATSDFIASADNDGNSYIGHYIDTGICNSTFDGSEAGNVKTVTVSAAGSGYEVGDLIYIDGGNNNAILEVLTLSGSGVATVGVFDSGSGYTVTTGLTTSVHTTSGSGCVVDITVLLDYTIYSANDGYLYTSGGNTVIGTSDATYSVKIHTGGSDSAKLRVTVDDSYSTFTNVIKPKQAITASAPAYVKGGIYFDTTLNKLRVGGASGWETITSS